MVSKSKINSILVAVDGSENGYRAVAMAAELASKLGASLALLHVISDKPLPKELQDMIEFEQINDSRNDILKNSGELILDKAVHIVKLRIQADSSRQIEQGDPADAIVQYAEDNQVDLIVLGRRGLNEDNAMLLGSVSRKVTNLTTINCLMVK